MRPNPGKPIFLIALTAMASLLLCLYLQPRLGAALALGLPLVLLVLVSLGILARHFSAPSLPLPDNVGLDWSIAYQRQMTLVVRWVYPAMGVFVLSLALLALSAFTVSDSGLPLCRLDDDAPSPLQLVLLTTALGSIVTVIAALYCWARCPGCGQLPPGSGGSTGGVPLHLESCPRCGATLYRPGQPN
ncbi:hypothetical protein [Ferrimonas sp.]|uniref:hypothetical protein n=1 Tax=Ferrimonas sp. TaxID=2080861 RepID=UPI003A929E3B